MKSRTVSRLPLFGLLLVVMPTLGLAQDVIGAQLDGYQTALAEALLRHAPANEIAELRRAFRISRSSHDLLLETMRVESGPLLSRSRCQLVRATRIAEIKRMIEEME